MKVEINKVYELQNKDLDTPDFIIPISVITFNIDKGNYQLNIKRENVWYKTKESGIENVMSKKEFMKNYKKIEA